MRLTPCPVALPRSWLSSAAAGVTIGVEIKILWRVLVASSSTPSTRRLLDGVAVAVPHRVHPTHWLISTQVTIGELEEEEHPRRGLTFLLGGLDEEEQIHVRACAEINQRVACTQ